MAACAGGDNKKEKDLVSETPPNSRATNGSLDYETLSVTSSHFLIKGPHVRSRHVLPRSSGGLANLLYILDMISLSEADVAELTQPYGHLKTSQDICS